jgi:hypothetical protein
VTLLVDLAEAPVFATAARTWTWGDVFLATRLWGEWDELVDSTRDADAPPEAVKQAGREWRVARRLIAGDELKAWLARRRLSVADWNAYLRRAIGERAEGAPAQPDLLWAEGACSGTWQDVAQRLAARAAAWEEAGTSDATQPPAPAWFTRMPSAADARQIGLDPGRVAARCEELWAAELALARLQADAAASEAVAGAVSSHNVDWLRVDCDWLEAGDENVAREAALLARADGLALADVAQRAGLALEPRRIYVGETDAALQPTLISAAPGDLVGPLAIGANGDSRWLLARVRDKIVPTLDDPDIRARAEEAVIGAAIARAVQQHVTWHEHD